MSKRDRHAGSAEAKQRIRLPIFLAMLPEHRKPLFLRDETSGRWALMVFTSLEKYGSFRNQMRGRNCPPFMLAEMATTAVLAKFLRELPAEQKWPETNDHHVILNPTGDSSKLPEEVTRLTAKKLLAATS